MKRPLAGAGAAAELQVEGAAHTSQVFAAGNALFQEMMTLQKVSGIGLSISNSGFRSGHFKM